MTLISELPAELEARLKNEARSRGITIEALAIEILNAYLDEVDRERDSAT